AITKDLRNDLAALKSLASSPDASIAIEDATGVLQDFDQMDRRARDFTRARQLTSASDLIFADGFDLTKKTGDAVDRALAAELADRNGVLGFLKRREAYALAGGTAVIAIVLALLVPLRREKTADQVRALPVVPAPPVVSAETLTDLNDFGVVSKPTRAPVAARSAGDLQRIAGLCTDLAKVTDTRGLPDILERAAAILDASGMVVW